MFRILFIDSTHPSFPLKLKSLGFDVTEGWNWSVDEIKDKLHLYNGLVIRSRFKITSDLIDKCTDLKFIARVGAGMENIDVNYAESIGIRCLHAPEGNRDAVAEHALAMILNLFNNITKAQLEVKNGQWIREANRGIELSGKTVGIIGYGNMGSAFAQRLFGFNVKILAHDLYKKGFGTNFIKECSLNDLFEEADIVSIHLPLSIETTHYVNTAFINSFKKPIYLINTARGKNVSTLDLVEALKNKKISGACLDVLEHEAVSFEKFNLNELSNELKEAYNYLLNSTQVIITPHIAGWTHESNQKMADVLIEKIKTLTGG